MCIFPEGGPSQTGNGALVRSYWSQCDGHKASYSDARQAAGFSVEQAYPYVDLLHPWNIQDGNTAMREAVM